MSAAAATSAVKSADRVLAILDLLAERGTLTFTEIADALALPKSSTHNLLATMLEREYIELEEERRAYRLGIRVWQIAQSRRDVEDVRLVLKPLMNALCEHTKETVQLAQLEDADAVYLEINESPHPMKLSSTVGARLPAHASGLGKTLLAHLDPDDARTRLTHHELVRLTPNTITDLDRLMKELARIRQLGYGTDNEEFAIGCRCTAMPIRDATGEVVAALSVSIPTPRWSRDVAARTRQLLGETVAEAQATLARRAC
jgi:DNA-binding IclR family transcriptional regulator